MPLNQLFKILMGIMLIEKSSQLSISVLLRTGVSLSLVLCLNRFRLKVSNQIHTTKKKSELWRSMTDTSISNPSVPRPYS